MMISHPSMAGQLNLEKIIPADVGDQIIDKPVEALQAFCCGDFTKPLDNGGFLHYSISGKPKTAPCVYTINS